LDKENEEAKQASKKTERVNWKFRKLVRNVQTTDIKNEVDKCSTRGAVSRYNNINHHNAEAVKDTINEEHRFKEMFTFHAATRFIDRLVSYDEESEDIDIQVPHALDVFERTLQRAIK
jgi:hypothetical protein